MLVNFSFGLLVSMETLLPVLITTIVFVLLGLITFALAVISVGPVLMAIYHIRFERRRWSESMFSDSGSSDNDED